MDEQFARNMDTIQRELSRPSSEVIFRPSSFKMVTEHGTLCPKCTWRRFIFNVWRPLKRKILGA